MTMNKSFVRCLYKRSRRKMIHTSRSDRRCIGLGLIWHIHASGDQRKRKVLLHPPIKFQKPGSVLLRAGLSCVQEPNHRPHEKAHEPFSRWANCLNGGPNIKRTGQRASPLAPTRRRLSGRVVAPTTTSWPRGLPRPPRRRRRRSQ